MFNFGIVIDSFIFKIHLLSQTERKIIWISAVSHEQVYKIEKNISSGKNNYKAIISILVTQ